MKLKRLLAVLLSAAALFTLLAAPAQAGYFPDIYDSDVARAADTLCALGVISGMDDGTYQPEGHLTRVQFCKMAIEIMGKGELAKAQMNRTIFVDVGSTHWGRGYANLAATLVVDEASGTRLMIGTGNGRFEPNRDISYQEAVTMLLRMLGYGAEANRSWPYGAVQTAAELGLDEGISVSVPSAPLTRGQAAVLFCRLLAVPAKGETKPYAQALGTLVEDAIVLSANSTINGQSGWVITTKGGPYRPAGAVDETLVGQRGDILLDKDGRFVTLLTDQSQCVTVTVARTQGNYLHASTGARYSFDSATPVYTGTSGEISTYAEMLPSILPGDVVTIYLDEAGKVIGMYANVSSSLEGSFMVVQGPVSAAGLYPLTGSDYNYTVRKNGSTISLNEIKQYDVLTYDPISKVLNVCDVRLSCVYENASPSPAAPSKITAAGGNTFDVMAGAMDSIAQYRIGQSFTLLFTADGRVAGAAGSYGAGYGVSGNAMGVVTGGKLSLVGTRVTLDLTAAASAGSMDGQLVSVSGGRGQLYLTPVSLSYAAGDFVKAAMRLGSLPVSDSVQLYEQGVNGLSAVSLSSLPATVPAYQIRGYHTDSSGRVDLIILTNFTGDTYTYGRIEPASRTEEVPVKGKGTPQAQGDGTYRDEDGNAVNSAGELLNSDGTVKKEKKTIQQLKFVTPGSSETYDTANGLAVYSCFGTITTYTDPETRETLASVGSTLTAIPNARSADFYTVEGVNYVRVNDRVYEVASDVLCYNATASGGHWVFNPDATGPDDLYVYVADNLWFSSLLEARTYSATLTLYVDSVGQKVRAVSA